MVETPIWHGELLPTLDGKQFLTMDQQGGVIRLYDAATMKQVRAFERGHMHFWQAAWFPNGRLLTDGDGSTRIWDVSAGVPIHEYRGQAGIACVAVSQDGNQFLTGYEADRKIRVWDLITKTMRFEIAEQVCHPNSAHFVLGGIGSFSLPVNRSWASADLTVHGHTVHFVTAHLESLDPRLADAQAQELLAGPANSKLPVVVGADFNAPADGSAAGAAYSDFANATTGFVDAWKARHAHAPGYTWGPQLDPQSPDVQLTQRIDFIFVHGTARVLQTFEAGFTRHDRKPGNVWPSDHAAVTSLVQF